MTYKGRSLKGLFWGLAFLLAGIYFTVNPYKIEISWQASRATATAAREVWIVGQYLDIDGQKLDLAARPALFIDDSCRELLAAAILIPVERRPYILVKAAAQPDFMPAELEYYWAPDTGTMSPALVWYDQKMIGYMYAAVEPELYKMRYPMLIGEGRVDNIGLAGDNRNAVRAVEQISGLVLQPGETFSFYEYVVPSVANGYQEGLTLFNTEDGPQWLPDVGGGICRTATVLNYAVEDAGLEVLERHQHTRPVSFAEAGEDTAVARSAGWDYQFKNTGARSIQIVGQQNGEYLQLKIYELLDEE